MERDTATRVMDWAALAGIAEFPADSSLPGLGTFESKDASRLFGANKEALRPESHPITGWSGLVCGDFYAAFDDVGKLQVLNYGFRPGDLLTEPVIEAISGNAESSNHSSLGSGLHLNDVLEVGLGGQRLGGFVTLPRYAALFGSCNSLSLSGRGSDKFIGVSIRGRSAVLAADFLLKAFKAPAAEVFHIDYCLYGLSLVSHKTEAAFNGAGAQGEFA
jgi:hypothetical protein